VKYAGVIAGPDRKSISPAFQQAAIDALGLDMVYEAWPTPVDGLSTRVSTLRGDSVLGANVTIPHKEAIFPLMDETDEVSNAVGALNTVVNRSGKLLGYNTDVEGFLRGLREDGNCEPEGKRALVAGAGGAARAVVVALARGGARSITVINRTYPRASQLVEALRTNARSTELQALPDVYPSWATTARACDLLINCTAAGSGAPAEPESEENSAVPLDILHSGMLVYDLVYLPAETALMAAARRCGARVVGGLPMLVYQGAASFQLWTGKEAPLDVMLEAAKRALGQEEGAAA
jgi:shikimate dehydrogenase